MTIQYKKFCCPGWTKLIGTESMQTIEQACLLGNLQEIDKILDQSAPIDKIDDFMSAISCSIEYQNLKVFNHLLEKKHFQDFIILQQAQLKTFIIQNDSPEFMQAFNNILNQLGALDSFFGQQIELPLQEFETILLPLDAEEQQVISDLTQYYQTVLSNHTLEYHLQELRDFLAKKYQENPATFESIELPLHWEAFHHLASEENYPLILKTYHQHSIHTAWRYLLTTNPWRSQEYVSYFKQSHKSSLWFIILIWFAARDLNFSEEHAQIHLQQFIETLAGFNRAGNTDALHGDKPIPSKDIRRVLLKILNHHPLVAILDDNLVKNEEKMFIEKKWKDIFIHYSIEQLLQVKYHWDKIQQKNHPKDSKKPLEKFNLTNHEIDEFQNLMTSKWRKRWLENKQLIENSRQRLNSSELLCTQLKKIFCELLEKHSTISLNTPPSLQFFRQQKTISDVEVLFSDKDLIL